MKKICFVIALTLILSATLYSCDVNTYRIEKIGDVRVKYACDLILEKAEKRI